LVVADGAGGTGGGAFAAQQVCDQAVSEFHRGTADNWDPWPYINYLLFIIKSVYKEFENRLGQIKSPRGAKMQMFEAAIGKFGGAFSLSQLEGACPGVSRDMIRFTLRNLQEQGIVECLGRGPGAEWHKKR
jgi:hypothetical protein